uniref:ADP-ribosylation factor-like protein 6-interacting protein 1 n=1 Tax=Clastoptera arizonana TaxID=38151 RepID=A0A1B6CAJ3_9HEMI
MADVQIIEEENEIKKLKRDIEGWREIIIHANSVLLWEKNWYPSLIVGVSTVFFLILWLLEPSVLSTVSGICLIITLIDYLVPAISANVFSPVNWTGTEEKKLEDICRDIITTKAILIGAWNAFKELKMTKPKLVCSRRYSLIFLKQ